MVIGENVALIAVRYSTAQHSTAQHSTAQHSTAQHSTIPAAIPRDFVAVVTALRCSENAVGTLMDHWGHSDDLG